MLDQASPIVALEGITRRYGDMIAINDVTLEVPRGTILGVIGPSGSGKTTLIRMLTGTLAPSQGTLSVLGQHPRRFTRAAREKLGYMPQHFVLYDELTAAENLSFVASLFGLLWPKRGRRVNEMLKLLELWDARGRRARQLSGGMQRRLELACALVHDPLLVIADEPTAGLDPILRQKIWAEFRRRRDLGRTLVVSTQVVGEAEYCDMVAVLSDGRVIAVAQPDELRRLALGGDVIEITTAQAFDARSLDDSPGVRGVRQDTPRHFLVIADEVSTATPRVLQTIRGLGTEVVASTEYRPNFDEVFTRLIAGADGRAAHSGEEDRRGRDRGSASRAA